MVASSSLEYRQSFLAESKPGIIEKERKWVSYHDLRMPSIPCGKHAVTTRDYNADHVQMGFALSWTSTPLLMSNEVYSSRQRRRHTRKSKFIPDEDQVYTHVDRGWTARGRKRVLVPLKDSDEDELRAETIDMNAQTTAGQSGQIDDDYIDNIGDWQDDAGEPSVRQRLGKVNDSASVICNYVESHCK